MVEVTLFGSIKRTLYMDFITYLQNYNDLAVALSGGVDSSYLLYAVKKAGVRCKAYTVKSQFIPRFELDDAIHIAKFLNVPHEILDINVLDCDDIVNNSSDRCYYCKHHVFSLLCKEAKRDGFTIIADGTNASDNIDDRPGIRAIRELSVVSPLRDYGLKKSDIRTLSQKANLFTWNKPSYACLATRFQEGETITRNRLVDLELAESYLFFLGFIDFRVRLQGNVAKIQVPEHQMTMIIAYRESIINYFKKIFDDIVLDLEPR